MSKRKSVLSDIKKSLAIVLALVLTFSGLFIMATNASEAFEIIDMGKMFGAGYTSHNENDSHSDANIVYQTYKEVCVSGLGEVDVDNDPVLEAIVYLTIDGNDYEVIKYTSAPAYSDYFTGISDYGNGTYGACIVPVYYSDINRSVELTYGDDCLYNDSGDRTTIYSYVDPYWGYSKELIDALDAKGIIDKNDIDWEAFVEYITSAETNRNYWVQYTLTDAAFNTEQYVQEDVSIYGFVVHGFEEASTYEYGKKVGYNRIENLSDLHNEDKFNHIKMYKGNMYVDAENLDALGGTLSIPNENKSGLYNMNSLFLNDDILFNDGYNAVTAKKGYTILTGALPETLGTKEEVIDEYFYMFFDKEYEDSDFSNMSGYNIYASVSWDVAYGEQKINSGEYVYYVERENVYKLKRGGFASLYNNFSNEDLVIFESAPLPEIDVINETELLDAYYEYLWVVCYRMLSDGYVEVDKSYKIMSEDEVLLECDINVAASILSAMAYFVENGYADISEIPDYETCYDVILNKVTDIVPITSEYMATSNYLQMYSDFEWMYDRSPEEIVDLLELVGLDINICKNVRYIQINRKGDYVSDYSTLENDLIQEYGEDMWNDFCEYIEDNYITERNSYIITEGDNAQKNTSMDVYASELSIPLTKFDVDNLGEANQLSQLWYTGNEDNYLLPFLYEGGKYDISYNGKKVNLDYWKFNDIGGVWSPTFEPLFFLENDNLYETSLGSIVFAKAPERIEEQNEIICDDDICEITWETPSDNGAEILGYQISVVPRTRARSLPADDQYITTGEDAGSYTDPGDNYTITWTTDKTSYIVQTYGAAVDVYVRAVNVIGSGPVQHFGISPTAPTETIEIIGADSVDAGTASNYDVNNSSDVNVEADCTYSVQNAPVGITITADGKLSVTEDCTLSSVTIIATGKTGSAYEGLTASKTITINSNEAPDNTPEDTPDNIVNPDTGKTIVFAVLALAITGVAISFMVRKKRITE